VDLSQINDSVSLASAMTEPTAALTSAAAGLDGPVLILGGSGKMGPELAMTLARADRGAGTQREITVAATFGSAGATRSRQRLQAAGIRCVTADLTDPAAIEALPDAGHVVYMLGLKFGSNSDWRRAFHLNSVVPYLVGERFADAAFVVFSSTNPYAPVRVSAGELPSGANETAPLVPDGIYGWSVAAREAAFATTALRHPAQRICIFRLAYAQHLGYGVVRDLADMVWRGERVSLAVPAVNLISQRDAIDYALRCLACAANPPWTVNSAGPAVRVQDLARRLADALGREARFAGPPGATALLAADLRCRETFGPPRDGPDAIIGAVAAWVAGGGASWDKPTMFGRADRSY
jgi:nucleoside-diphosphate-sugar epimerase